jgi:two-component sensor histidine kinase
MTDTSLVGRSLGVLVEALGIPMLNDQKPGTQVRSSFHLMRKSDCSIHSTPPRPQAKGLGLSIAARIIEQHGGALRYQTEVGHGATFGIVLPLKPTNEKMIFYWSQTTPHWLRQLAFTLVFS